MGTFTSTWLPNLICTTFGIFLGWLGTHRYSAQQTKDLKSHHDSLLRAIQNAEAKGVVTATRDSKGQVLRLDTVATGSVAASVTPPSAGTTLVIASTGKP
jgi:hypothetical protein